MTTRKNRRPLPSAELLRARFSYTQETGELVWRRREPEHFATKLAWATWNTRRAGKPAGSITSRGYRCVNIDGGLYQAHRLIWKLVTGEEPPDGIDHRDGDKTNNRWSNFRAATQQEQTWNSSIRRNNKFDLRGVSPRGGRWRAKIGVNGRQLNLGTFDTPRTASLAYEIIARVVHGKFYRSPEDWTDAYGRFFRATAGAAP